MEESKTMEQEPVTQEEEIVVEDTKAEDVSETADQEEAQAEPETAEEDAGTDKKGFFGKKKEKKDKKDEQIAELTDKLKRQLAEFENFRNRTDKEKSQMYAVGAKDVIEKILPVIDNFERGLKSIPEDQSKYLAEEMMDCAQISSALDERMQKVRDVIMQAEKKEEEEEEKSSGVEPLMLRGLTERIRQKNL